MNRITCVYTGFNGEIKSGEAYQLISTVNKIGFPQITIINEKGVEGSYPLRCFDYAGVING